MHTSNSEKIRAPDGNQTNDLPYTSLLLKLLGHRNSYGERSHYILGYDTRTVYHTVTGITVCHGCNYCFNWITQSL